MFNIQATPEQGWPIWSQTITTKSVVQVASCCVEALVQAGAEDAVIEVIAERDAPELSWDQLFSAAKT
jgi:uncharacterized membrane protein YjjP (DUF1212 family)